MDSMNQNQNYKIMSWNVRGLNNSALIKQDLLQAVQYFFTLNQQVLHFLNQAFIVLILKKTHPHRVSEYRPISLTHTFAKVVTKILANRLAPVLPSLIFHNHTIFIQKRCIHDSFIYAQEVVRRLHKRKIPALFMKLDISKSFGTVNWPYLLSIMTFLGFGQLWTNWIAMLWCTISPSVLLNGVPGRRILYCRG
jgi:hypothetical protein